MTSGVSLPDLHDIILLLLSFPVAYYVITILRFRNAWRKPPLYKRRFSVPHTFISVIVPFKNEEHALSALLKGLTTQSLSHQHFEVIFIDDHSDDNSCEVIRQEDLTGLDYRILTSTGKGKKAALSCGIEAAMGQLIVATDADTIPNSKWLESIYNWYIENDASMMIGPVKMVSPGSMLSDFQMLDYYALQMSGGGAALSGHPVFCSGANLVFEMNVWLEVHNKQSGTHLASGDDVFLLHAFKKMGKRIAFLKNSGAMVCTQTEKSWRRYFYQRMRWGGKSTSYKDWDTILLALLVLYTNLWILILIPVMFFLDSAWMFFAIIFLAKFIADYLLLKEGNAFYSIRFSLFKYALQALIYPLLLVINAVGGFFYSLVNRPMHWK